MAGRALYMSGAYTVLGATGSIGAQALDVIRTCLPHASVSALSARSNIEKLAALIGEFSPALACVPDEAAANKLKALLKKTKTPLEIVTGSAGLEYAAREYGDTVINALSGRAGLAPTLAALNAGKDVALANKESLVSAGGLVMETAKAHNARVIPVDSEHSAICQCLRGGAGGRPEKIILTASGGPFREWPAERIETAAAADALKHPTWLMGGKITVDCATLMNKGLEVIEAMHLFDIDAERIEVIIHPQSVIHSMVEYADGAVIAQMGATDMRLPILWALTAPERVKNPFPKLDLIKASGLTFERPDTERFPCLKLALYAARAGKTLPAVMNALNELAVGLYLRGEIGFYDISRLISDAFGSYTVTEIRGIEDVRAAEVWAEAFFKKYYGKC